MTVHRVNIVVTQNQPTKVNFPYDDMLMEQVAEISRITAEVTDVLNSSRVTRSIVMTLEVEESETVSPQ